MVRSINYCFTYTIHTPGRMLLRSGSRGLASAVSLDIAAVHAAFARIRGAPVPARQTPLLHADVGPPGIASYFKCEHLQRTGSFKYRGALNAVFSLDDTAAAGGIVAHSSGNHGAACAAAAAARAVPCTVVVPEGTPAAKVANMERYGARVVVCEPTQTARTATSAAIAAETGATFVHPYDDAAVIAGQGTIGVEIAEELPEVDMVERPLRVAFRPAPDGI